MGPKLSLERVFFSLKSSFLRRVQGHVLGLQCHQSGCNFWLEWFGRIHGTWGICQMSRFGDGGSTRCSLGPKRSLERVFFSLKSPFLRWVQWHVLGLQCLQSGCNFWLEWFGLINGTWGICQMSSFGDGGPDKCSMSPKPSFERVFFSLKSPFLREVQRHVLGLQCHQSGCHFWLEWFGWINGTWGTCQVSRFGDGGPARCSMGPKSSLERLRLSLKSPFLREVQWHILGLQCHQSGCNFWLEWFVWING